MLTELIIFDCDGVLIDSEIVVCGIVSGVLCDLGYPIDVGGVIRRFAGRSECEMVAEVEADWGRALPPSFFSTCKRRTSEAYRSGLNAIHGVRRILETVEIPVCVASSAAPDKLRLGLQSTGLYNLLAPNLISASYVAKGKPAPDVFLYAAGWMRCAVSECVVIEDSVPGVTAAAQAGMRVIGFTGGSHCAPGHGRRLIDAGAESILTRMSDLPGLVPGAFGRQAKAS